MNSGLSAYKEQQRIETNKRIEEAIDTLYENGVKVTKRSIAEEAGLSYYTLQKDHVNEYLMSNPKYNSDVAASPNYPAENESLKAQLMLTSKKLTSKTKQCKLLEAELTKAKEEYKQLQDKYRYLLGAYQSEVGAKRVSF